MPKRVTMTLDEADDVDYVIRLLAALIRNRDDRDGFVTGETAFPLTEPRPLLAIQKFREAIGRARLRR